MNLNFPTGQTSGFQFPSPAGYGSLASYGGGGSGGVSPLPGSGQPVDYSLTSGFGTGTGPGMSQMGGMNSGPGFGFNMPTAQLAMSGIGTLGNLWGAFQAQKLAREQFNFTRDTTNTNLANQLQSYNTALTDRAAARGKVQGQSKEEVDAYVQANRLTRS